MRGNTLESTAEGVQIRKFLNSSGRCLSGPEDWDERKWEYGGSGWGMNGAPKSGHDRK